MNNEELKKTRLRLIHEAVRMEKKPERVAHLSNFYTWTQLQFSELPLSETLRDYNVLEKCIRQFQETFNFDALLGVGFRNPFKVTDEMGTSFHVVDDVHGAVSYKDIELMKENEYGLFINNMYKFLWEEVMPRKFTAFNREKAGEKLYRAGKAYKEMTDSRNKIIKMLNDDYGVPEPLFDGGIPWLAFGIDYFFMTYRGIAGTSIDLRRRPEELLQACRVLDQELIDPLISEEALKITGSDENLPFDFSSFFLAHTILNKKNFEKYYWPSFKKAIDAIVKADKTIYILTEGNFDRFFEYLQDFPKGHIALHLEMDDIFEARKKLPNICLIGGMPTILLSTGTEQQCIDYAKRLIEEVGQDGGYILSQNKMVSFRNDCNPANLKAVSDFVTNYKA